MAQIQAFSGMIEKIPKNIGSTWSRDAAEDD